MICRPSTPRPGRRSPQPNAALVAAVLTAVAGSLPAQAQFVERADSLPGASRVLTGDVDGDGDVDLLLSSPQDHLLLNDGRGAFVDVTATHLPARGGPAYRGLALGDVDGDGDLDIVGAGELLRNDGRGVFTDDSAGNIVWGGGYAPILGDVDGDGDLDLAVASVGLTGCGGDKNLLHLNDGSGRFTEVTGTHMPPNPEITMAVGFGDVDLDGDLDLVCANDAIYCTGGRAGINRLYLNDGAGRFVDATSTHMPGDPAYGESVKVADVDADGDLDLVFGDALQHKLFLNDGTGVFANATSTRMPTPGDWGPGAIGDVDADDDPDLVFGMSRQQPGVIGARNLLYVNDGAGRFAQAATGRMAPERNATRGVALADLDGDGDLDLVCADDGVSRIYTNLLGQLEAPAAPAIGQPWQLDLYARYGTPRLFDVALPVVSLGASRASSPFGEVGIDLTVSASLPALLLSPASGAGSTSLAIPADPQLVGLPLYAQALLVPYPGVPKLTNVVRSAVR